MSPGAVISQLDVMNSNLERASNNIAQALNAISKFEDTTDKMASESYNNIREYYYSLHTPFLQGLTMYIERMKQENNNYKRCISGYLAGIGYIDEDELKRDRESIKRQMNQVHGLMSTTKGFYSGYVSALEHALALIEKKLKQINDFKGVSSGLYQGMGNYGKCIKGGLNEIGSKHFDKITGKYRLHRINLNWEKELKHVLVRHEVKMGKEQINSTYDKRVDALCLEYLKTNMPQLFEVKYVPGMPSIEVENQRHILEEKYVEELRNYLMEEEPRVINSYIRGQGIPSSVRQIYEDDFERLLSEVIIVVDESDSNIEFNRVKMDGNWLRLYSGPTVNAEMRTVQPHSEANRYDWGMPEELSKIKNDEGKLVYQRGDITLNYRNVVENSGKTPVVNVIDNSNLYTDAEGRYYVAVGPNVMNPEHKEDQIINADEMNYGTKIDIVVLDETTQKEYYIPAVVADVKAHTYPDGLYQTNKTYPNGTSGSGNNADGSTVEFIGYGIPDGTVNDTNNYRIKEIIIYDGEFNYK